MEILLHAPPTVTTGYGVTTINLIRELDKLNVKVSLFPIGPCHVDNDEDVQLLNKCISNQSNFDKNAPCIKIFHHNDFGTRIGNGRFIGFPIFELDQFTDREKHHCSTLDDLFVCSKWAQDIVKKETGINAKVIQLGVDSNIFHPPNSSDEFDSSKPSPNKCIFLNVGKWEVRKGHDILYDLFARAFDKNDDVELWMIPFNQFLNKDETAYWEDKYKKSELSYKIKVFNRVPTHKDLAELYRYVTCGIFPAKSEGWNLELLEMMACGKEVITTNYAGHTEYCNKNNSYLVDIEHTIPAYDGKWFKGQGNWALIGSKQEQQFIDHMQSIYTKWKSGQSLYNGSGVETAEKFSWKAAAERLLTFL